MFYIWLMMRIMELMCLLCMAQASYRLIRIATFYLFDWFIILFSL
jgi:hypothetical protein